MVDKISKAIDSNDYSVGIFIDLAKAFDTVDHKILLSKLENYGIRGTQLKWFRSYLEGRIQRVSCNGALSSPGYITSGVPQGSNLGPLLFLLYINDLAKVSSALYFVLFADDTNIFFTNSSWTSLIEIINKELSKVNKWFIVNKLTLNIDKTNFIVFKSHRKIRPTLGTISLDGIPITEVDSIKFLGVYIDKHLTWKAHINYIASKVAKNIGIISRVARILPRDIRLNLYYSLIFPYLSYCNLVWASNYDHRLHKLWVLQKKATRMIVMAPSRCHSLPIFKDLNLLELKQIRIFQIGVLFYMYVQNLLPITFAGYFTLTSTIHDHFTRGASLYRPVKARTNIRSFSLKVTGPSVWNALPAEIRASNNKYEFKKRLRHFLTEL